MAEYSVYRPYIVYFVLIDRLHQLLKVSSLIRYSRPMQSINGCSISVDGQSTDANTSSLIEYIVINIVV